MRERSVSNGAGFAWRPLVAFFGFMAIALFFLLSEHRAHVLGWLPLLLFAACPLMHLFMHHNHGGGHDAREHGRRIEPATAADGEI